MTLHEFVLVSVATDVRLLSSHGVFLNQFYTYVHLANMRVVHISVHLELSPLSLFSCKGLKGHS